MVAPRVPGPPPPRPSKQLSVHDLDEPASVSREDADAARLRVTMKLIRQEQERAEAAERALDKMKNEREQRDSSISLSASAVTVKKGGQRFVIPLAVVLSVAPVLWAGVNDYLEVKRQIKEQTKGFASFEEHFGKIEQKLVEQAKSQAELREDVARLSGYLAAVLPKAGVSVPGAESGASFVSVVVDPLPIGAVRQTPVNVRTKVPAPAPRRP